MCVDRYGVGPSRPDENPAGAECVCVCVHNGANDR
jgi:hypothetical protein